MSLLSYSTQLLAYVSLPFYFHNVLNRNVVEIGMLLTAWPLATMLTSLVAGELIKSSSPTRSIYRTITTFDRHSFNDMAARTTLEPADPLADRYLWFWFWTIPVPNNFLIMTSVPHENSGIASGLLGSSRLIGQIIGSVLVAFFFNNFGRNVTTISLFAGALFSFMSLAVSYLRFRSASQRVGFLRRLCEPVNKIISGCY